MSASTEGEERWADLGLVGEDDGHNNLLPGHSYTILQVKEFKNNALVNIRNPWGGFEWYDFNKIVIGAVYDIIFFNGFIIFLCCF